MSDSIVDAHVHVWDPRRHSYPWLPDDATSQLPDEIDLADGRTGRVVFVEAAAAPTDADAELRWVVSLADAWPQLAGVVAAVDLRRIAQDPALLDVLADEPLVVGVRHILQDEPPTAFDDGAVVDGLRAVAASGLTFDACVVHTQLPGLVRLLDRVDGLHTVLDHMGKPPVTEGLQSSAGHRWRAALADLAERDGLHVKVSGLAPEAATHADYVRNAPHFVSTAVELFGPARAMLGSDWPVSVGAPRGSASEWFDLALDAAALSGDERRDLASATAERFYRLSRS